MVSALAAAASAKPFTGMGAGVSKPEHRPSHAPFRQLWWIRQLETKSNARAAAQ